MKILIEKITKPLFTFFLGILVATVITNVYAHGGSLNLIHACVKNTNGSLRIVDANTTCNNGETALDWNTQGVPGLGTFLDNLSGVDLSAADLRYRNFRNANFSNSSLDSTGFSGADLTNANFSGTIAEFSSYSGDLTGVNFSNADLKFASFDNVSGSQTNFTNTNLNQAHFNGTVNLTNTIWSNTTCPDGTNSDNNSGTCVGHLNP